VLCCGVSVLLHEAIKGGSAGVCVLIDCLVCYSIIIPLEKKYQKKFPIYAAINQPIYHPSHALPHSLHLGQGLKPNSALRFDLCCMHLLSFMQSIQQHTLDAVNCLHPLVGLVAMSFLMLSIFSESLCNYFTHSTYICDSTHVVMSPTPKEKTKAKK